MRGFVSISDDEGMKILADSSAESCSDLKSNAAAFFIIPDDEDDDCVLGLDSKNCVCVWNASALWDVNHVNRYELDWGSDLNRR